MTSLKRSLTRAGNHIGVWMYRTLDGRMSSGSKNVHVLMITTPGRRTGIPRSTCVRYLETSAGFVVWGTGSGSRQDPDWFQNLRKAATAQVQVRERQFTVRPHELHGRGAGRHVARHHPGPGARGQQVRAEGGAHDPGGRSRTSSGLKARPSWEIRPRGTAPSRSECDSPID